MSCSARDFVTLSQSFLNFFVSVQSNFRRYITDCSITLHRSNLSTLIPPHRRKKHQTQAKPRSICQTRSFEHTLRIPYRQRCRNKFVYSLLSCLNLASNFNLSLPTHTRQCVCARTEPRRASRMGVSVWAKK